MASRIDEIRKQFEDMQTAPRPAGRRAFGSADDAGVSGVPLASDQPGRLTVGRRAVGSVVEGIAPFAQGNNSDPPNGDADDAAQAESLESAGDSSKAKAVPGSPSAVENSDPNASSTNTSTTSANHDAQGEPQSTSTTTSGKANGEQGDGDSQEAPVTGGVTAMRTEGDDEEKEEGTKTLQESFSEEVADIAALDIELGHRLSTVLSEAGSPSASPRKSVAQATEEDSAPSADANAAKGEESKTSEAEPSVAEGAPAEEQAASQAEQVEESIAMGSAVAGAPVAYGAAATPSVKATTADAGQGGATKEEATTATPAPDTPVVASSVPKRVARRRLSMADVTPRRFSPARQALEHSIAQIRSIDGPLGERLAAKLKEIQSPYSVMTDDLDASPIPAAQDGDTRSPDASPLAAVPEEEDHQTEQATPKGSTPKTGGKPGTPRSVPLRDQPVSAEHLWGLLMERDRDLALAAEMGEMLVVKNKELVESHSHDLDAKDERIHHLEDELRALRKDHEAEVRAHSEEINALNDRMESMQDVLDTRQHSFSLDDSNVFGKDERSELLLQIQLKDDELKDAQDYIQDALLTKEKASAAYNALQKQVDKLETQLTYAKDEISHLEGEADQGVENKEALVFAEKQIKDLKDENSGLHQELADQAPLLSQIEQLRASNAQLQKEVAEAREHLQASREKVSVLEHEQRHSVHERDSHLDHTASHSSSGPRGASMLDELMQAVKQEDTAEGEAGRAPTAKPDATTQPSTTEGASTTPEPSKTTPKPDITETYDETDNDGGHKFSPDCLPCIRKRLRALEAKLETKKRVEPSRQVVGDDPLWGTRRWGRFYKVVDSTRVAMWSDGD